jgi:hypothetical protein
MVNLNSDSGLIQGQVNYVGNGKPWLDAWPESRHAGIPAKPRAKLNPSLRVAKQEVTQAV